MSATDLSSKLGELVELREKVRAVFEEGSASRRAVEVFDTVVGDLHIPPTRTSPDILYEANVRARVLRCKLICNAALRFFGSSPNLFVASQLLSICGRARDRIELPEWEQEFRCLVHSVYVAYCRFPTDEYFFERKPGEREQFELFAGAACAVFHAVLRGEIAPNTENPQPRLDLENRGHNFGG